MSKSSKPLTVVAFGARGTGKTHWCRQYIEGQKPQRLIVWDFKNDPGLSGLGKPYTSLPEFIKSLSAPRFASRYLVDHSGRLPIQKQFDFFCRAAWEAGCLMMYVPELPEVTRAGSAPEAWRRCVNVGREYQDKGKLKWLSIVADGQRPAEVDKSIISNADVIHSGRLAFLDDAKYMAKSINCTPQELMALPDWHWIERRPGAFEPVRGGPETHSAKKTTPRKKAMKPA